MSQIINDGEKYNSILCVAGILLLIFVGGTFSVVVPQWLLVLIALALVGSLYRSLRDD